MNIVIFEDEKLAADKLCGLLDELLPEGKVLAVLDSVSKALIFWRQSSRMWSFQISNLPMD